MGLQPLIDRLIYCLRLLSQDIMIRIISCNGISCGISLWQDEPATTRQADQRITCTKALLHGEKHCYHV